MIRKACPADIPAIVELAILALRAERYPSLVVSREKIQCMVRECVSSAAHFAWIAEEGEALTGAVGAMVMEGPWFERKEATVVMFYCRAPGEGVKLIRTFLRWARSRPIIKRIVFTVEFDADSRVCKLLERLGLNRAFPVYIETR